MAYSIAISGYERNVFLSSYPCINDNYFTSVYGSYNLIAYWSYKALCVSAWLFRGEAYTFNMAC